MTSAKKLLATPLVENRKLQIYGRPDGVDAADGAIIPIEIKSHKNVTRLDELELAFYWLLLEPNRTRRVEPRGVVILLRDGEDEEVEVPIPPHRIAEVRRTLSEIRAARGDGVRPIICGCHVCSRLRREEVLKAVHATEDLTLIYGIGRKYGPVLEEMGIARWTDLESCKPGRVINALARRGYFVSPRQIEWWKRHARSYASAAPVAFGVEPPLPTSYIALDLEYNPPHIWLMGIAVVEEGRRKVRSLWADGNAGLKRNLVELNEIIQAHPSLPILTWAGEGADLPNLLEAIHRLHPEPPKKGGWVEPHRMVAPFLERHIDVYQYVLRGLRLPIPELGLKEVARYFGIPRTSNVISGLDAQFKYEECRLAKGPQKKALRDELIAYNRDDLEALIDTTDRVRELMKNAEPIILPRIRKRRRRPRPSGKHLRTVRVAVGPTPIDLGSRYRLKSQIAPEERERHEACLDFRRKVYAFGPGIGLECHVPLPPGLLRSCGMDVGEVARHMGFKSINAFAVRAWDLYEHGQDARPKELKQRLVRPAVERILEQP